MEINFEEPILEECKQGKWTKIYADDKYIGDASLALCIVLWDLVTDSEKAKQNLRDIIFKAVLESMKDYISKRNFSMISISKDINVYGDESFEEVMKEKGFTFDDYNYVNYICGDPESI